MRKQEIIRQMRTILLRRRQAIRRSLDDAQSQLSPANDRDVGDSVDVALDAESHEINSQLAQVESAELAQIKVALDRMAAGTYGVCDDCRRSIPIARLRAVPYVTLCIKCQRDRETGKGSPLPWVERAANDLLQKGNGAGVS